MPAKFRDDLGESFIVTKGVGKCLFVFSSEEWENFAGKLKGLPISDVAAQSFTRMLLSLIHISPKAGYSCRRNSVTI